MKSLLIMVSVVFAASTLNGQTIHWQKSYGGLLDEFVWEHMKLKDGYILCGTTSSNNADVAGFNGGINDAWVVRTDNAGNILWAKCYGGSSSDVIHGLDTTLDGGFILGGESQSIDIGGGSNINRGDDDYWLLKIDSVGSVIWSKTLGGSDMDWIWDVRHTYDAGFIVCGLSLSNDFDKTVSYGDLDWWIVKFNDAGMVQWQKTLGGSDDDWPYSVRETRDSGFVISGFTRSRDIDITDTTNNNGHSDCWIAKLNRTGSLQWQKKIGGSGQEGLWDIVQTFDGGYVAAGYTESTNGDVTNNHGLFDAWVTKISDQGNLQWQKTYGGTLDETAYSIIQVLDSGFIIAGSTESNDGDVSFNHSASVNDAWVVKTDQSGTIEWEKSYGGSFSDIAHDVNQISDSIFTLAITSRSVNGDITNPKGGRDIWITKIGPTTNAINSFSEENEIKVFPTFTDGIVNVVLPPDLRTATLRVFTETGQEVDFKAENSNLSKTINLKGFSAGLYFLHIQHKDKSKIYKLFIYK